MSDFVNTVDIIDDDVLMDSLITKSFSGSFNDDKITKIKQCAFAYCANLESVCFPNVTEIRAEAFRCTGLKEITPDTFPLVTNIAYTYIGYTFAESALETVDWPSLAHIGDSNTFSDCSSLRSISLPNLTTLNASNMFKGCTSLESINLPSVTSVSSGMFLGCTSLESINLPSVTSVGGSAFQDCTSLESINLPEAINIVEYSFQNCTSLTRIVLPKADNLGRIAYGQTFKNCTSLKFVDLPMVTSIPYAAFLNCSSLVALVIRTDAVPSARNADMFKGTPIASGTGYIYVPRDLVNSYATANYWSNYAAQYRPLEDYTVDGTTTGELIEETESLSLNVTELTFSDANTQTLTATGVFGIYDAITWTTSDKTIARVKNGIVTPVKDGTATITVTCGDYSATCAVTVNAGLEASANILDNIDWNAGYIDNNGSITAGGTDDTYTTKFDISEYSDASIIVTLLDVTSNPAYSRICYYNESESIISATQGVAGSGCVTITSTVPNNAVYAAISINKSSGLSGIEITCDDVLIGSVEYTS